MSKKKPKQRLPKVKFQPPTPKGDEILSSLPFNIGDLLIEDGITTGNERADSFGRRLQLTSLTSDQITVLDILHPAVLSGKSTASAAITIKASDLQWQYDFMTQEGLLDPDEEIVDTTAIRIVIRQALTSERLPDEYPSAFETRRDVWLNNGVMSDGSVSRMETCPVCFTVKNISGSCLCD